MAGWERGKESTTELVARQLKNSEDGTYTGGV